MASINKRPDGRWRARYRDAAGREHAKHFERKVDAERFRAGIASQLLTGSYVDPARSRVTMREWSTRWLAGLQVKPSTRARYESEVRSRIVPAWGSVPLSGVAHADVVGWVAGLSASGLAPATVRHAHRVLSLMLGLAVRDGRLSRNPADGVRLPAASTPQKRFLTHAQVADLAEAAGDYGLAVRVLAYAGLRFGELAALRVERVDLLRRRIEVVESVTEIAGRASFGTPKSHQRRSVPIPRGIAEDLAVRLAGRAPGDFVFPAPDGGVLGLGNFRARVFDPAARAAGLGGLTPHELRHTAASLAVSAGANVKSVQRMLGHKSASMTLDVYSGLFDDDLDAVAERLDAAAADSLADSVRTGAPVVGIREARTSR